LAILVGGGPAPGINGVISAVTIEALQQGIEVFGIRDGNSSIMKGSDELMRLSGADPSKVDDFAAWIRSGG
jgi:6-phosphofructokinase 1